MVLSQPIDVVYTWVDDSFPGYRDLLNRYAAMPQDRNPNRTRDNVDLLKYSLRSLNAFLPWIRRVYLVTCAPQVPRWLNRGAERLSVVHHDAFMDAGVLPTFNSFAIVSSLHRIPGLSRRFLYVEDDMLFGAPVTAGDFVDGTGRLKVYRRLGLTCPASRRDRDDLSPWNVALAQSNALLDEAFGKSRRRGVNHVPLFVDRDLWDEMIALWAEPFARTRASRFRAKYNVVPEYLYPHFLLATGRARAEGTVHTYTRTYYRALENPYLLTWTAFAGIALLRPAMITLGDGFGEAPNPRVVAMTRRFLERTYPVRSPFEL